MMEMPPLDQPIGRWAAENPAVIPVLEQLGLDYCCRGRVSIQEALTAAGVTVQQLQEALGQLRNGPPPDDSWADLDAAALCDHIEQVHHAYLRDALPRTERLLGKVTQAHQERHPELRRVQEVFQRLKQELEMHMFKEEKILFPAIRQLQEGTAGAFPFGSVENPIRVMEEEHDFAAGALRAMRRETRGFQVPEDGCTSYQALMEELRQLEKDLHLHIHKENNVLFPMAWQLERARGGSSGVCQIDAPENPPN